METTNTNFITAESPLKNYINFLLTNNLHELNNEDQEIIEEVEHFFFENLGPESRNRKISSISTIKDFLNNVVNDCLIDDVKHNLIVLVNIKLLEVYNMEVLLSGIRLLYRLRKEEIYEHLTQFVTSIGDVISITLELDILFSEIEEYTFQVLTKYSRERILMLKTQLFETQALLNNNNN